MQPSDRPSQSPVESPDIYEVAYAEDTGSFGLIQRGKELPWFQFIREITQNGIEGVRATGEPGEVAWVCDKYEQKRTGALKLACVDTGTGMTKDELLQYSRELHSGSKELGLTDNYGIGGKISTAVRNALGVEWRSWKSGAEYGYRCRLRYYPESGKVGLEALGEDDEGNPLFAVPTTPDMKPRRIRDASRGTAVVLLGNEESHDTARQPDGAPANLTNLWVGKALGSRYFSIPDGVTISALELLRDGQHQGSAFEGFGAYYDSCASQRGTVELSDATAHWWVIGTLEKEGRRDAMYPSTPFVGALFQGELYEPTQTRFGVHRNHAYHRLRAFGFLYVANQLAIIIEPHDEEYHPNAGRTSLHYHGQTLSELDRWGEWGREFKDKMPAELKELREEARRQKSSELDLSNHRKALVEMYERLKIKRYRPSSAGDTDIDDDGGLGGTPRDEGGEQGDGDGTSGTEGGSKSGKDTANEKPGSGTKGKETRWKPPRDPDWATPEEQPELTDRAAFWNEYDERLVCNEEFRVFEEVTDLLCDLYRDNPSFDRSEIVRAVREVVAETLLEVVMSAQVLTDTGKAAWKAKNKKNLLSEEALTAAVLTRTQLYAAARPRLSQKLGKPEEA